MAINGHFWIENSDGEVIWDPHFPTYDLICRIRSANPKKPHYRKKSATRQREMISQHILPMLTSVKRAMKEGYVPPEDFYTPQSHNCASNCVRYKLKGGEGTICYGDMGWEQTGGTIWYEFEDEASDMDHFVASQMEQHKAMSQMTKKERRDLKKKQQKDDKKNAKAKAKYHAQMAQVPRSNADQMERMVACGGKVLACGAVMATMATLASNGY